MLEIKDILMKANAMEASDIHIIVGKPPMFRVNGSLEEMRGADKIIPQDAQRLAYSMMNEDQQDIFEKLMDLDFSFGIGGLGRYRVNVHMQRGTVGISIRAINSEIVALEKLGQPASVSKFIQNKNGLILVTGPTGSGKSTTLAALIDMINETKPDHIITIEDPIEFLHRHKKSVVEQRELKADTTSFKDALKYALRQDPDVILIGEMRDLETIESALTAAETGHLVFGTLHTNDASSTIDRIVDVFPTGQQQQIRLQLSNSLRGVVSQVLLPKASGNGRAMASEVLVSTPAVGNLIREGKTNQIYSMIETGAKFGMRSMDQALKQLYDNGDIEYDEMLKRMKNPNFM